MDNIEASFSSESFGVQTEGGFPSVEKNQYVNNCRSYFLITINNYMPKLKVRLNELGISGDKKEEILLQFRNKVNATKRVLENSPSPIILKIENIDGILCNNAGEQYRVSCRIPVESSVDEVREAIEGLKGSLQDQERWQEWITQFNKKLMSKKTFSNVLVYSLWKKLARKNAVWEEWVLSKRGNWANITQNHERISIINGLFSELVSEVKNILSSPDVIISAKLPKYRGGAMKLLIFGESGRGVSVEYQNGKFKFHTLIIADYSYEERGVTITEK